MLPSERIETAFVRIGGSLNYKLVFRALAYLSMHDKECFSYEEIRAIAISLAPDFYSELKKSELFLYKDNFKRYYLDDFLIADMRYENIERIIEALEPLFVIDERKDAHLCYLYDKELQDLLCSYAVTHEEKLTKSIAEYKLG